MKPILAVIVALVALSASGVATAGDSKCKPGQVFDEVSGKCVTPRGS